MGRCSHRAVFFIHTDCSITKFLNRILGLEVHKQNHLFQYFMDNFDYLIEKDKKEGKYDMGILGTRPRHAGHHYSCAFHPRHLLYSLETRLSDFAESLA